MSDYDKPDPSTFIAMLQVREGETDRVDEYLPSADPYYATSSRKKKEPPARKWKPTATTENSRPDEWMGAGKPKARSWKVKSVSTKPPSTPSDSDSDTDSNDNDKTPDHRESTPPVKQKVEPAPTPTPAVSNDEDSAVEVESESEMEVGSDSEVEVESDSEDEEEVALVKPESPKKKTELPKKKTESLKKETFKIERPDATAFKNAMRMERDAGAGASHIDEYLPSAAHDYESSQKKRGEPPPKKKTESPKKETFEIERPDATAFKNAMRMERDAGASHIDEYLPSAHDQSSQRKRGEPVVRKWKPTPTTDNSRPDDWIGSPSPSVPRRSWTAKAKSPSGRGNPAHANASPVRRSSTAPKWKPSPSATSSKVGIPSVFLSPSQGAKTSVAAPSLAKWKPHSPAPAKSSSSAKKSSQEPDHYDSQASLSTGSLQKGESDFEVYSEPEREAPTKGDDDAKKGHTRMWKSSSEFDYSTNKQVEYDKPDPSAFIAMRQVREGDTNRVDEFLPSANPYGISSRKKKEPARKWKPTATTENSRPDEWMGGGKPKARSWKVKSVSDKPFVPESDDDDDDDNNNETVDSIPKWKAKTVEKTPEPAPAPAVAPVPEPTPAPSLVAAPQPVAKEDPAAVADDDDDYTEVEVESDTEVEVESEDEEEPSKKPEPPKKEAPAKLKSPKKEAPAKPKSPKKYDSPKDEIERPDPEIFLKAMRQGREGEAMRVDEFLPSANPYGTSSQKKRGEPVKKWKPTATTENSRPDEWMGAGKPKARSWKVKSVSTKPPSTPSDSDSD
jgi:hypothetical protein